MRRDLSRIGRRNINTALLFMILLKFASYKYGYNVECDSVNSVCCFKRFVVCSLVGIFWDLFFMGPLFQV